MFAFLAPLVSIHTSFGTRLFLFTDILTTPHFDPSRSGMSRSWIWDCYEEFIISIFFLSWSIVPLFYLVNLVGTMGKEEHHDEQRLAAVGNAGQGKVFLGKADLLKALKLYNCITNIQGEPST